MAGPGSQPPDLDALRAAMARVEQRPARPRLVSSGPGADPQADAGAAPRRTARGSVVRASAVDGPQLRVVPALPAEAATDGDTEPDAHAVARQIVLKRLAAAPRSRAELETTLRKRGCEPRVSDAVLTAFEEVGLIDDREFARTLAGSLRERKGLAASGLARELTKRGVDRAIVSQVVAEVGGDLDEDAERARSLAAARLARMPSSLPREAVSRRLAGFLARKGYPASICGQVVRELVTQREFD